MSILAGVLDINNKVSQKQLAEDQKAQSILQNAQTLEDIHIQTNAYNKNIPVVFGIASLAGNIIWTGTLTSYLLKEGGATVQDSLYDQHFGSKIKNTVSTNASFSMVYNLDFAIAICEGEVSSLFEIKANNETLNLSKYKHRFYKGSNTQEQDSLIAEMHGIERTPAFRNLCYIVFEDFPISDFGNAIPTFIFTIEKNSTTNNPLSQNVKGITIIPGTGEFVYHTQKVAKYDVAYSPNGDVLLQETARACNYNNNENKANVLVSLDNLKKELPNIEWVSLVVCWFGNSLDIANCSVYPACEFNDVFQKTAPFDWFVANKTRINARVIGKDSVGNLLYGGTPSDSSVTALLAELKSRGYKVCLIPMMMMEVAQKPWRGRLTGNYLDVAHFFEKEDGYKNFIRHYANLTKNFVDAFAIGSELIGLTKINDGQNNFPAVNKLCELASDIRGIMGQGVKLTYAADWSEYHHTQAGFYNMDKLWCNTNIDFIGIDAYFPLTSTVTTPSKNEIMEGWHSGEGWDFYYNYERTQSFPLAKEWAWKNIKWFVENSHINADGTTTPWQPNMKKVWFCEYGFPSVNLCTNQPNVFYDPTSSESFFPRSSSGNVDFQAQANAIIATEEYWQNSTLVENKLLWTWDARPYPFFPKLSNVWSDCANWQYGHWVCGKVLHASVESIITFCFNRAGITNYEIINATGITNGLVVSGEKTIFNILKTLLLVYNLVVYEENGIIKVNSIANLRTEIKHSEQILVDTVNQEILHSIIIEKGHKLLKRLTIMYYDIEKDYQISHIYAENTNNNQGAEEIISVPFVLTAYTAKNLAAKVLMMANAITIHQISFPLEENLSVATILDIAQDQTMGIVEKIITDTTMQRVEVAILPPALLESVASYSVHYPILPTLIPVEDLPLPQLEIIDTNNFTNIAITEGTFVLWFAFKNVPPSGASVYYSLDDSSYIKMFDTYQNSITGKVISQNLQQINSNLKDESSIIQVALNNKNSLISITESQMLSHANLCIIGGELLSFQNANKVANGVYDISGIIHARFGTSFNPNINNERFIHMQKNIRQFGFATSVQKLYFKIVKTGDIIEHAPATEFIPQKNSVKDWAIKYASTTLMNQDILITWKEMAAVQGRYFGKAQTFLNSFTVNINNKRIVNVYGESQFLYTKAMQNADLFTGSISITIV